jgi:O-antigen/teichoic acid export membrane protein
VPSLLSFRLGSLVSEARWVVALLGAGLAVRIAFSAYDGVMTGCHRWDLHNALNSGFYAATTIAMMAALAAGWGLWGLAAAHFVGNGVTELARYAVAHRVCPELRVSWREVRWREARKLIKFGGKTFTGTVAGMLTNQTNKLLVLSFLGPAALALYSRPVALVTSVGVFIGKFAFTLTPTASSLQAAGRTEDLARLLVNSTRVAAYLALPPLLFLAILGSPVLRLWMGPGYDVGIVLSILALGQLPSATQQPARSILVGMNAHGRTAVAGLGAAIVAVALSFVALGPLGLGLPGAAFAVAVVPTLLTGYYLGVACRCVGCRSCRTSLARGADLSCVPFRWLWCCSWCVRCTRTDR